VRYHGEGIPSEDGGNAVLRAEDRLDVVEEAADVHLAVVEESDPLPGQRSERRRDIRW
jgi:hypothetical protein